MPIPGSHIFPVYITRTNSFSFIFAYCLRKSFIHIIFIMEFFGLAKHNRNPKMLFVFFKNFFSYAVIIVKTSLCYSCIKSYRLMSLSYHPVKTKSAILASTVCHNKSHLHKLLSMFYSF